uniref:non-specific serine/threonine protein kinase n=1 Tax=Clastoptera arizonana TaxID=38151 RepID=A0A1B6E368_9HEMI
MSLRLIIHKAFHHGRIILRGFRPNPELVDFAKNGIIPQGIKLHTGVAGKAPNATKPEGIQYHINTVRKLFVNNILNRVTNSLAADLRRRAAKQLVFGNSAPFLALVGVGLASGSGILTKEDEFDGVSFEIRETISRMQKKLAQAETKIFRSDVVKLDNLEIGPSIAKGSNAVVYAARIKEIKDSPTLHMEDPSSNFPYAVKMMFNYDAESNASSILKAMYRETVPARCHYLNDEVDKWEEKFAENVVSIPPHPNIVAMHCVFADRVPDIPGSKVLYPDALPTRINPDGYGRNMSLFLLMKRYDTSLKEFLSEKKPSIREAILLLTQLLEAITHLNKYGVAHRDLKSDNILLDTSEGEEVCPMLVITDFGCCLADRTNGLYMPYNTYDTERGGNAALMAPEVACANPGMFSYINYSKTDAWAAGSIAYELLTDNGNPFYRSNTKDNLRNTTYSNEDLPQFSDNVPNIISRLVYDLLARNPSERLSAELAATICQLYLFAPCAWLRSSQSEPLPSSSEVLQWLLCLTTKILGEGRIHRDSNKKEQTITEFQLITTFLRRSNLHIIRDALQWLQRA